MKKGKACEYTITKVGVLALLYMIGNMVYAASFTVFVADDLSNALTIGKFQVPIGEYVKASLEFTKKEYLDWQGTYSSLFAQALLSPLNNYGFRQLRCVMAFITLFFFFALIVLVLSSVSKIDKKYNYVKIGVVTIVTFLFCGYDSYREIFFWYTGGLSYGLPISLLFLALASLLRIDETKKNSYVTWATILGILAMGGSLAISALGCFFAVLVCFYRYLIVKKYPAKSLIATSVWIISAGINAAAPGNFIRHGRFDQTGVHPLIALSDSLDMVSSRWQFFFNSTNFAFILFLLVLVGCYIEIKGGVAEETNSLKCRLCVAMLGLITPIATAFPVALGYSSDMLPNRCEFVIDTAIIFPTVYISLLSGIVIVRVIGREQRKTAIISLVMIMIATFMLDGYGLNNVKIREISHQLRDNTFQDHYYSCKSFVYGLEKYAKGEDVRISIDDFPEDIDNVVNLSLSDDPEYWVNQSVSRYYGFNSIAVDLEE